MIKAPLKFLRSTRNTHVYITPVEKPANKYEVLETVYIRKSHLPNPPPETLRITIEHD